MKKVIALLVVGNLLFGSLTLGLLTLGAGTLSLTLGSLTLSSCSSKNNPANRRIIDSKTAPVAKKKAGEKNEDTKEKEDQKDGHILLWTARHAWSYSYAIGGVLAFIAVCSAIGYYVKHKPEPKLNSNLSGLSESQPQNHNSSSGHKLYDGSHTPQPLKYINSEHRAEYVYVYALFDVCKLIPVKTELVDAVEGIIAHTKVTKYQDGSSLISEVAKLFSFRKGKEYVAEIKPNESNTYHVANKNTFTCPGRNGIEDAYPLLWGNFPREEKGVALIVNSLTRELHREDNGDPVMSNIPVSIGAPLTKGGTRLNVRDNGEIVEPAKTPELKEAIYLKYLNSEHRAEYVYGEEKSSSSSSSSPVCDLIPVKAELVGAVGEIGAHTKVTKYQDGSSLIAEVAQLSSFGIGKGKTIGAEIKPNESNTYHVADENTFTCPGRKGIEDTDPLLYGNFPNEEKGVVLIVNSISRKLHRRDNGAPVMSNIPVSTRASLKQGGTRLNVRDNGEIVEPAKTPELHPIIKYPHKDNRPEYVCGRGSDNAYQLIPVKIDLVSDLNGTEAQIRSFSSGDYINEVKKVYSIRIGGDGWDYENGYGFEIYPNAEKTCHVVAHECIVTLPGRRDTVNPSPLLWANFPDKSSARLIVGPLTRELYRNNCGKFIRIDPCTRILYSNDNVFGIQISIGAPLTKGGTLLEVLDDGEVVVPAETPPLKPVSPVSEE